MDPRDEPEIREALALLRRWESAAADPEAAGRFSQAIELLDGYLEGDPETPHRAFVENVKVAHTRRLLQQLARVDPREFGLWLEYALAVMSLVKGEAEALQKKHPDLRRDVDAFLGVWRGTLEQAVRGR